MRSHKHLRIFPIDSGNQEKRKVLSIATDVGFLVIYFLLLFQRQTTHTALRHSSEYHVRRRVKQNGRQGNYCSQSLNIDRIERTYCGEVQQYDEDDNLLYILYFKDRIVFSLNASGAFSDGIAPADTWFEVNIMLLLTNKLYLWSTISRISTLIRLSQSSTIICVVTSLEMLAKSIRCHLSSCIIFCNRERWLETVRISFGCLVTGLNLKSMFYTWNVWQVKKIIRHEIYYHLQTTGTKRITLLKYS